MPNARRALPAHGFPQGSPHIGHSLQEHTTQKETDMVNRNGSNNGHSNGTGNGLVHINGNGRQPDAAHRQRRTTSCSGTGCRPPSRAL